jgi:hypothetical protein
MDCLLNNIFCKLNTGLHTAKKSSVCRRSLLYNLTQQTIMKYQTFEQDGIGKVFITCFINIPGNDLIFSKFERQIFLKLYRPSSLRCCLSEK